MALGATISPLLRFAGPYSYNAASPSGLFVRGNGADHWLSTADVDPLTFFFFIAGNATAIGGYFFTVDDTGAPNGGTVNVTAEDGAGTQSVSLLNTTTATFLGFVADGPLVSLELSPAGTDDLVTANDLYLAVAAVPEPGTVLTIPTGLAILAAAINRRRV